jgi:hypothetical protein
MSFEDDDKKAGLGATKTLRRLVCALAPLLTSACGASPESPPTAAVAADTGVADTTVADTGLADTTVPETTVADTTVADVAADSVPTEGGPPPPASGTIVLDGCLGLTGVAERCTLVTNGDGCTGGKCRKLVVVFSGGEMGCLTGSGYKDALAGFAARGYAAVCINYFDTSTGSGSKPYIDEASRIDFAVREATTGAWARTYWTGEDLLLEGISHGATAPLILMARTTLDDQPHWRGSRFTGGCFFDGAYDQAATASLLATGALGGKPCTFPVSHARWLERYCGPGATGATCDLTKEPKALVDTITRVPPAAFAIRDFKMFECGSALPACSGDIVAGAPVEALCKSLEAGPAHTCSFGALPTDGHLTCHGNQYDSCRTWFEGLLPP